MSKRASLFALALLAAVPQSRAGSIVCPPDAPELVRLAAAEIRRYVYLRTGELMGIRLDGVNKPDEADGGIILKNDPTLGPGQFRLKTEGPALTIAGGDDLAILYGAYRFAEGMGVRFYLHGDVIPDQPMKTLPTMNEEGRPLFALRGIQPFHDFMEGPDWWNADDYKAHAAQMVKMRMNFIGLHSYPWFKPWRHVPPEPGVWIGLPEDVDERGRVRFSYPASWANTARPGPGADNAWGHKPGPTGGFSAGAAQFFERDDFGADLMVSLTPWPKTPGDCNLLFNRVGDLFGEVFGFARRIGVKVCVGTETPLWIPDEVRARLTAQGRDPEDPAVLRELCEGMFTRIQRAHPVDFFWLWTPERPLDPAKTLADLGMIREAARAATPLVQTAVCGWGWLAHQFAGFDKATPGDVAFSCINEQLGFAPVTPAFGELPTRGKWCIPWMEDDTSMTTPQLFAGRVRKDAADALRMGCQGLLGIHWRTRAIAPQLAMLARCGWQNPETDGPLRDILGSEGTARVRTHPGRGLPVADFYADWCAAEFGPAVAADAAEQFARMDGRMPRPACWALGGHYGSSAGPGIVGDADARPWEQVAPDYVFVDEFAALRPRITGAGALDRFDYWLGQFQYLKAMGKLRCTRSVFDQATYRAEKDPAAIPAAVEARRQLNADWTAMMTHLLETVSSPGELGTVANLELHTRRSGGYLENFDPRLEKILGKPLPDDCAASTGYTGRPRLIVPTIRGLLEAGESLRLKIIAIPAASPVVHHRPLGRGEWTHLPAIHVARGVYEVRLPTAREDFEYYVTVGENLVWPATAPGMNQTVVVLPQIPIGVSK